MSSADKNRFIAYRAYRKLADSYAEMIDTKPHNAYLEKPATLSLLPDVRGIKALDAGCGTGLYSEWLVDHGADVVSVDANPHMLKHARKRLKGRAEIRLHDLREPLTFLEESSFDLVLSSLVMHYIEDWSPVLREFQRLLKEEGIFVFSIEHPFNEFYKKEGSRNYFAVEKVEMWWTGFGEKVLVPSYRRPMGYVIEALREAHFCLDRMVESRPTSDYLRADPEGYERVKNKPTFLCIKAISRTPPLSQPLP